MDKDKLNNVLNYQVPPKLINVFVFLVFFCFSCLLFVFNTEAIAVIDDSFNTFIFWFTTWYGVCAYFTLAIIFGVLYCLTGNLFVSYVLLEIVTLCWGIANRIVYFTRDQFITISEFGVLGDAAGVEIDMTMFYHPIMVILILVGCINGLLLWLFSKKNKKDTFVKTKKKNAFILRMCIIVTLISAFVILHVKPSYISFYDISSYKKIGNVVWFCQSLFGHALEDVSHEKVLSIYDDFHEYVSVNDEISEKRPNVIVIMSEAFWDTNNLDGIVEANENPMDKYKELTEHAVTGQVAVNIYGGGTNISEFEFLTGINTRYLNVPSCYGDLYLHKQESLISYLQKLGYYTMAFHPYDREFWDREIGYTNMGFEQFYSDVDFINREMCHGYISDKSLTKEIIERFEKQKLVEPKQPVFTFAVSIQNHVSDMINFDNESRKLGCTGITTKIIDKELDEEIAEDVELYYNGLRESIEALEELMTYFSSYEEDTVIVFFGDHAPGFVKQICDTNSSEIEMNLYRTPYMIWTNYSNDYESYGDFNISYLSSVLLDYLEFPKPNQYYMNMYMLENYPVDTRYEQERTDDLDEERLLDMMSITSTICKRFPKEEMAMPFWSVAE